MARHRLAPAALVAACLVSGGAAHAGDRDRALALVPADASAIAAIDLDRLRGSPYRAAIVAWLGRGGGLAGHAQALAAAGIDVGKDLSSILIAGDLSGAGDRAVIILEGRFRRQRIAALARKPAVARKHAGVTYFEGPEASVALLGTRLVLAPDAARVRAVIDLYRGRGRSAARDRRLSPLLRELDRSRDGWVLLAPATSDPAELEKTFRMPGVVVIAASVGLGRGMALSGRVEAADPAAARRLTDMLQQGGRLLARDRRVGPVARKLAVVRAGRAVKLSLDLDDAELRQLLELAGASPF